MKEIPTKIFPQLTGSAARKGGFSSQTHNIIRIFSSLFVLEILGLKYFGLILLHPVWSDGQLNI